MTRGRIDLGNHKLAGLFRAPAERRPWKRARREKCPDGTYRQIWKLTAGAVRDTFACHPEYLTEAGRQAAERSIVKRVTGTLHGYATQLAGGRSTGSADALGDVAAIGPISGTNGDGTHGTLSVGCRWARVVSACLWRGAKNGPPEIQREPQDG